MRRGIFTIAGLVLALSTAATAAPSTRPTTLPAEATIEQVIASVPPATLFPDASGLIGGTADATQQQLQDWADRNLKGKRIRLAVSYESHGNARNGTVPVAYGNAKVAAGKKAWPVIIHQAGKKLGSMPATDVPRLSKLTRGSSPLQLTGTITHVSFDPDGIVIDVADATLALPAK